MENSWLRWRKFVYVSWEDLQAILKTARYPEPSTYGMGSWDMPK